MKFTKILPYKLRRVLPILGLAGATIALNGCSKDDEQIAQHDVVYTWGAKNFSEIWPTDNLIESAKRRDVRNVILQSDGKSWRYAFNEQEILDDYLNTLMRMIPTEYHYKFIGGGELNGLVLRFPEKKKELEERWKYKVNGLTPEELQELLQNQR